MDEKQKNYIISETLRLLKDGKYLDPFSVSIQLNIAPSTIKKVADYTIINQRSKKVVFRNLDWKNLLKGVKVESMMKYFFHFPSFWPYLSLLHKVEDFGFLFYFFGIFGNSSYFLEQFSPDGECSLYSFAAHFFPVDKLMQQCTLYSYSYLEVPSLNTFIGGFYGIRSERKAEIFKLLLGKI